MFGIYTDDENFPAPKKRGGESKTGPRFALKSKENLENLPSGKVADAAPRRRALGDISNRASRDQPSAMKAKPPALSPGALGPPPSRPGPEPAPLPCEELAAPPAGSYDGEPRTLPVLSRLSISSCESGRFSPSKLDLEALSLEILHPEALDDIRDASDDIEPSSTVPNLDVLAPSCPGGLEYDGLDEVGPRSRGCDLARLLPIDEAEYEVSIPDHVELDDFSDLCSVLAF